MTEHIPVWGESSCLKLFMIFSTVIATRIGYSSAGFLHKSKSTVKRHSVNHIFRNSQPRVFGKSLFGTSGGHEIPEEFTKSYQISGIGQNSAVEMLTSTGHQLRTDVPKKMGGKDSAPQPVEMLLGAFLGCTQATAIFVGRQMKPRLLIEKIEFDVSACRDERGALELPIESLPSIPARLQSVSGIIRVYARRNAPISAEQLELLSEQTEARCPVANMMIASGCGINVKWVDGHEGS